jgi:hypothetical protein
MRFVSIAKTFACYLYPYILQRLTVNNGRRVRSFDKHLLSGLTTNQAALYGLS